jgi:hypothetical protein
MRQTTMAIVFDTLDLGDRHVVVGMKNTFITVSEQACGDERQQETGALAQSAASQGWDGSWHDPDSIQGSAGALRRAREPTGNPARIRVKSASRRTRHIRRRTADRRWRARRHRGTGALCRLIQWLEGRHHRESQNLDSSAGESDRTQAP